jgi:hypothetical protein
MVDSSSTFDALRVQTTVGSGERRRGGGGGEDDEEEDDERCQDDDDARRGASSRTANGFSQDAPYRDRTGDRDRRPQQQQQQQQRRGAGARDYPPPKTVAADSAAFALGKKWWRDVKGLPLELRDADDMGNICKWCHSALALAERATQFRETTAAADLRTKARDAERYWIENAREIAAIETKLSLEEVSDDRFPAHCLLFIVMCRCRLASVECEGQEDRALAATAADFPGARDSMAIVSEAPIMRYTASQLVSAIDAFGKSWTVTRVDISSFSYVDALAMCAASLLCRTQTERMMDIKHFRATHPTGRGDGDVAITATRKFVSELAARFGAFYLALASVRMFGTQCIDLRDRSAAGIAKARGELFELVQGRRGGSSEGDDFASDPDEETVDRILAAKGAVTEVLDYLSWWCSFGAGTVIANQKYSILLMKASLSPGDAAVYAVRRPVDRPDARTILAGMRGRVLASKILKDATMSPDRVSACASARLGGRKRKVAARIARVVASSAVSPSPEKITTTAAASASVTASASDDKPTDCQQKQGAVATSGASEDKSKSKGPASALLEDKNAGTIPAPPPPMAMHEWEQGSIKPRSIMTLAEEMAALAAIDAIISSSSKVELVESYVVDHADLYRAKKAGSFDMGVVPVIVRAGNSYDVVFKGKRICTSCLVESIVVWFCLLPRDSLVPKTPKSSDVIEMLAKNTHPHDVSRIARIVAACIDSSLGRSASGAWMQFAKAAASRDSDGASVSVVRVSISPRTAPPPTSRDLQSSLCEDYDDDEEEEEIVEMIDPTATFKTNTVISSARGCVPLQQPAHRHKRSFNGAFDGGASRCGSASGSGARKDVDNDRDVEMSESARMETSDRDPGTAPPRFRQRTDECRLAMRRGEQRSSHVHHQHHSDHNDHHHQHRGRQRDYGGTDDRDCSGANRGRVASDLAPRRLADDV